jgi:hypothetical protein
MVPSGGRYSRNDLYQKQDEISLLEFDSFKKMRFSFRSRLRDKATPRRRKEHIAPNIPENDDKNLALCGTMVKEPTQQLLHFDVRSDATLLVFIVRIRGTEQNVSRM